MEGLIQRQAYYLEQVKSTFHRYLYGQIDWTARMVGLLGPRGVGKTTMVLQHILEQLPTEETLYVVGDDLYFSNHTLLQLAENLVKQNFRHLIIDEIHKYANWSRELKQIYDLFPKLQVVFTGSSALDIMRGEADLSRRALMYQLQGLSFREYLSLFHGIHLPAYTLDEILRHEVKTDDDFHPLPYFGQYLRSGYYPFAKNGNFDMFLQQIINQTFDVDIPAFADLTATTARKLKQLLTIIAQSVPFKPNASKIAQMLDCDRHVLGDYFGYVERAGFITLLTDDTTGIRSLGKVEKIYLDNTNLIYGIGQANADVGNVRETFFMNQMRVHHRVQSSKTADFTIAGITFEVGGKGKTQRQIKDTPNAYVVKDDIEYGFRNTIPLWHFGLNY